MSNLYVISGVSGMTGNELARQIIKYSNNEVIGFDNFFASSIDTIADIIEDKRFTFFCYDCNSIDDMKKIEQLVRQKTKEKVIYIHCAAVVHTEHFYHVNHTFQTNVLGMQTFLNQAVAVNASVFINCSTSEVYSMQSACEGGIKEDDYILMATAQHSQRTSYATGKLMTEFFLMDAVKEQKIRGCSIRFANVYSKNELLPKHIIPHIVTSLQRNGSVTLLENAKLTKRTFLHNTDSCSAVLSLIQTDEALDGSIYNVATQEEVSILQLVDMIAKKMKIEKPQILFEGCRKADPLQRILCTDKIKGLTGWKPKVSLSEGLDQCIQSIRENT